jgi:hypothetical protein
VFYTVIETAKLSHVDPHAYLIWVLDRLAYRREIRGTPLEELTPWRYKELTKQREAEPARS